MPYCLHPSSKNTDIYIKIYYNGNASIPEPELLVMGSVQALSGSWGNSATWSLSEPYSAYEWFLVTVPAG
ncbi:hypothetical protein EMGBS15_05840 [Filimonas sp.]|nr:hypothetical protein EMGBS15_05840 [Filimonas sp.]